MPQQIDPSTGLPIGMGAGDGIAGAPATIPGLSGLTDARLVDDSYTLRPFEYFRNEGGRRYVQNALTNPNETPGYQPPPPPGASLPSPQTGGAGPNPMGQALPVPQTGGAEPNPGNQPFGSIPRFFGGNPWASFFQGLSRTQGGPSQSSAWGATPDGGAMPQRWQQTQRGFNPGTSASLPSPYPNAMRSAVMPPMWGGQSGNRSPFGQMALPEAGNQGGQSVPSWFRQFQAMLPQATALPQPQTTMQPLANAGYFPPPSLPAPVQQETFNGGPG